MQAKFFQIKHTLLDLRLCTVPILGIKERTNQMNGNGRSEFLRAVVGYIMADRKHNEDKTKELEI
jgi:hypothetical protein